MSFNQNSGTAVPTLINSSATILTANAVSSNALTVRQFGTGNVFSAQTTTGSTALFVGANGNVGVGTTSPQTALDVFTGTMNAATVVATTHYGAIAGSNTVGGTTITASTQFSGPGTGLTGSAASLSVGGSAGGLSGTPNITVGTVSGTTITASSSFSGPGTNLTGSAASLSVGGSAGSLSTTYTAGRILYGAGSGVPTTVSTLFYDSANGRVGIGSASPASTLDLSGGQLTSRYIISPSGNYLTIQNGAGGSQIGLQGTTTAITGGTVYMTGGNVGVGTVSPSGKLTVATSGGGTSAGGGWDANWSVVHGTTVGAAGGGVGIAFNDGNFGLLSCVAPSIGWRTMLYGAGRHDFYINGTFGLAMYNLMTGGATTISVDAGGGLQRGAVSDRRLKSNIVTMTDFGLKTITDLRPVTYEATPESLKRIGAGVHIGLVAQEVQTIFPYAVSADQDEQKTLTIDYIKLVPVMINAIKELSAENTALKTQMSSLEQRLAALESKLAA